MADEKNYECPECGIVGPVALFGRGADTGAQVPKILCSECRGHEQRARALCRESGVRYERPSRR